MSLSESEALLAMTIDRSVRCGKLKRLEFAFKTVKSCSRSSPVKWKTAPDGR